MPDACFDKPSATSSAECIIGGPACGKTTTLLERARVCAESGEGSVVYVCASELAADRAKRAISSWCCGGIEVKTGLELACEVLSDERYAARGLRNRLIGCAEQRALMEDVKVCGIKRRRLRELVAFLECSWSNLADDDPAWLKTNEEEMVAGLVRGNLEFTGGVLACEASALALRAVRGDAALRAAYARDHVFVDDYERLGRATQFLVNELVVASIAIAAGDVPFVDGGEPYPCTEGVREFFEANPAAMAERLFSCHRPSSVVLLLNALRADGSMKATELSVASGGRDASVACDASGGQDASDDRDASCFCPPPAVLCAGEPMDAAGPSAASLVRDASDGRGDFAGVSGPVVAGGIVEEFSDIAQRIERAIEQGISPSRIFIAGTNRMWRANVVRYLQQVGIAARELASGVRLRTPAMRVLVGEGDPLCRSVQIARLREIAQPQGLQLEGALSALAAGALEGADAHDPLLDGLVDAYWIARGKCAESAEASVAERAEVPMVEDSEELMAEGAKLPMLEGSEEPVAESSKVLALESAKTPVAESAVPPAVEGVEEPVTEGTEEPITKKMCGANAESLENGACGDAYDGAVKVGAPLDAVDREFDLVIFGGFVNGFIPSADYCDPAAMVGAARERAHAADIQALYRAVASARCGIVFTGFSECSLEAAERLKLHIARIKLKRGVRMCAIEPSLYASFVAFARP